VRRAVRPNGFAQHEAHDISCREADRLEDGHLWNPLSHGLRHHIASQEYQSEDDCSHDDQPDIREPPEPHDVQSHPALTLGFVIRICR
jgi:hypothetical protein